MISKEQTKITESTENQKGDNDVMVVKTSFVGEVQEDSISQTEFTHEQKDARPANTGLFFFF